MVIGETCPEIRKHAKSGEAMLIFYKPVGIILVCHYLTG
jgi:hypothetical protein